MTGAVNVLYDDAVTESQNLESTVFWDLYPLLAEDPQILSFLKEKNVSPIQYLVYLYDSVLKSENRAGRVITVILTLILAVVSFFAAQELPDAGPWAPWFAALAGMALGLFIGWGALRHMEGKRLLSFVDNPDNLSSDFTRLALLERLKFKYLKKIKDVTWDEIRQINPNLKKRCYRHVPDASMSEEEKEKFRKMTPEKQKHVERFTRLRKGSGWLILPMLLFPFDDSLFFFFWGWTFAGFWLLFESLISCLRREMGFSGEGGGDVVVYGKAAIFVALFMMFISFLIFILPGIAGMYEGILSEESLINEAVKWITTHGHLSKNVHS